MKSFYIPFYLILLIFLFLGGRAFSKGHRSGGGWISGHGVRGYFREGRWVNGYEVRGYERGRGEGNYGEDSYKEINSGCFLDPDCEARRDHIQNELRIWKSEKWLKRQPEKVQEEVTRLDGKDLLRQRASKEEFFKPAKPWNARTGYHTVYGHRRGREHRSSWARREFMRETGYPHGRPGYVIDHVVSLACGGPDDPSNMQWQTVEEAKEKDKWERKGCSR